MQGWLATIVGVVAGCCSTLPFVPQVLKIRREGDTRAISARMYVLRNAGFVLWLAYGLALGGGPLVAFNVVSLLLGGTVLVLKLRGKARRERAAGAFRNGCQCRPLRTGRSGRAAGTAAGPLLPDRGRDERVVGRGAGDGGGPVHDRQLRAAVAKAWREGDTRALSLRMYLALTAGFVLWLGYGLLIGSRPVIAFNVANLALSAAILRLKLRGGKRANRDRATGAPGLAGPGLRAAANSA